MPYATLEDLPKAVKSKLDEKQQKQWRAVFNSVMDKEDDETLAFQSAWAAVNKADWQADIDIIKLDSDQQLAFGWLSVSETADGSVVIDKQGDIIEPEDLEACAYEFVLNVRKAGDMHERTDNIGKVVESIVFTKEKQEALGIPAGVLPIGWWIGFKISDESTWAKVKNGTYTAFSIGGKGVRDDAD